MSEATITSGKVATIIGTDQIAINKGQRDGVQAGDSIVVLDQVTIADPDTQENLGAVLVTRARFSVGLIGERYTTGRIQDRITSVGLSAGVLTPTKKITPNPGSVNDSTVLISIGDLVQVRRGE